MKQLLNMHTLLAALLFCGWSSCSLLEHEAAPVPAYVYVPYVNFETVNNGVIKQGDNSQKFADVWIFTKGKLLGDIGFPALIPVQASGPTQLEFDAGILKTGQDQMRTPYPFTERQTIVRSLTPNKVDTVIPTIRYLSNTAFPIVEDFESNGFQFTYRDNAPGDTIVRINDSRALVPGKNSGMVKMGVASQKFEIVSNEFTRDQLQPTAGSPVYMELDYQSNIPINIGMYVQTSQGVKVDTILETYPTDKWNKVYVSFDADIGVEAITSRFKFYIVLIKNAGDPEPQVILDNIKLIHFE